MAEPSRLASALEYLSGLDAAVAPKLRAVSDAIDPVNVARRAGLNLPMAQQAAEAAHFVGPGADIEGMVNDAREGNAAFGRGDLLGALGGYGSAAMAIPMMALPGSVKDVKAGVKALSNALPMDEASRMARAAEQGYHTDLYHGTGSDIREFERGRRGLYATDRPNIADIYAKASDPSVGKDVRAQIADAGPNIMPLKLRGKVLEISDIGPTGNGWSTDNLAAALGVDMSGGRVRYRDLMDIAKERGYSAVKIKDMQDLGGQQDQWSILDPSALRSRFAAFDPSKIKSKDLLASALAAGVFEAGVAGSTNKEPE